VPEEEPTGLVARLRARGPELVAGIVAASLVVGIGLWLAGATAAANAVWGAGLLLVGLPLLVSVARRIRRGQPGADVIALLAIAGALALGQFFAGAVIALMLSGGELLDARAFQRARRELGALTSRAPTVAHVLRGDELVDTPAADVVPGDRLVVKQGEIVPVDGVIEGAQAVLDESALTGEPLPVTRAVGDDVRSGASVNGDAFSMRAVRTAADSTYARVVRLVESAEANRAPTVRLADSAAVVFLPVTLVTAAVGWIYSGDPTAALAVLVVATPCPLILATPIAFVSGIARAARSGVIVKGGAPLEQLGRTTVIALDKTGTLTSGAPLLTDGADDLLALAASAEQLSTHPLATALVAAARGRGLELRPAAEFHEEYGAGVSALVDDRRVRVGGARYTGVPPLDAEPGVAHAYVSIDGDSAGVLAFSDRLRPDAAELVSHLRRLDLRLLLLTGDIPAVAEQVARTVGIDDVVAHATPEDKAEAVSRLRKAGAVVTMVGDGINDAPALAAADVGIALGARGATVSSSAADAVIVVDDLDRVVVAITCGRRSLRVAREGVVLGMGLSGVLMVIAAAGSLTPVAGALAQEAIDVAAILNALRALRPGR
jgi:heavy metal translocating P-type ATPase